MRTHLRCLVVGFALAGFGAAPTVQAQSSGPVTFHAATSNASDDLDLLIDFSPPRIEFTAPLGGSRLGGTSTTITGSVTDSTKFPWESTDQPGHVFQTVEWGLSDGQFGVEGIAGTAPVVDGRFVIPDLPLFVGENVLYVHARDAAGFYETSALAFEVDPNAPAAALVGVLDGQAVLSQSLNVDLNFAAATTVVSLNGVADGRSFPAGIAPDIFDLPLQLGANTFTLALESGGQTSSFSFTLNRVASRGPIAIVQPMDRALVNTTSVPVSVRAPLSTPYVTLNGRPAQRGDDLQTFTADVPLAEGSNTVEAIAYPFGQRASVRIGLDTTPPRVIAMSPGTPRTLLGSVVKFQGVVSEPVRIDLYAAGYFYEARSIEISDPAGGFFAVRLHTFEIPDVALDPALNEIFMYLTDRAGNVTDVPIALTRSETALRILDPVAGSSVAALETSLRLEAVEALSLQALYVGGRQLTSFRSRALTPGIRQFDHIPLAPGVNDIRVVYQRYGGPQEVLVTTVTSTATPIATLRGQLTDAVTGAPVGGATVTITRGAEDLVLISGGDGRYQSDVPPGPFSLVVRRSGFIPALLSDDAAVGETLQMDAALLRWSTGILPATLTGSGAASNHLEGLVTSAADGLPLAGAQVRVTSAGATLTTLSGEDGAFEINGIPVGPFSVAVSKTGFFPFSYEIDNTEAVDVRLAPALHTSATEIAVVATVRNVLTDAVEPGVRATLLGPNLRTLSDAQGRFQFVHVPVGRHSLRLEKPGYADAIVTFDAPPQADGGPRTLLIPYPQAEGFGRYVAVSPGDIAYVRDRFSSRGVAGARVVVAGQTIIADSSGGFPIPALSEADPYDFVASAENYDPQTLRVVIAPGGNEPLEFDLLSQVRGSVSGTVRDAASQVGLSMATVMVAGSADQITHTNSDGSFLLDGVTPGTYALEITHPEYLTETIPSVSVMSDTSTPASASLAHRPVVGGIRGRVLDSDTGSAVANATVSQGGISTTSDALGGYALAGLPAGMTTLSVLAAGYPPATRDVVVAADRDTSTPTAVRFDLRISTSGVAPSPAVAEIMIGDGGRASDPSGRLTVILPPVSITADARVTVRLSDSPEVTSGQPIPLDPALQAPEIRAVGPEMTIRLEPLTPGGAIPHPLAPWILVQRYSAASAAAASAAEDALAPYVWNGSSFTMPQVVPYMHVTDAVDRVVITVINPNTTITGTPLYSGLHGKSLPLYAASIEPQPTPTEYDLTIQLGAPQQAPTPPDPRPFVQVRDLLDDPTLVDDPNTEPHPNSHPLIGIHGWDPEAIYEDTQSSTQVDARFRRIFTDLVAQTAGIYRPIWTSYNTRARVSAIGWGMYSRLSGAFGGSITGIPSDPDDPNSGLYKTVDVLGFSKGGLVERSLLCTPNRVVIQGAITLGTPHRGAMSRLRHLLDIPIQTADPTFPPYLDPLIDPTPPTIRDVIADLSPGTADLLDYDADENPYLAGLNDSPCSASKARNTLIAGDDAIEIDPRVILPALGQPDLSLVVWLESHGLVPEGTAEASAGLPATVIAQLLAPFVSLGNLLNSGPSDGVVPVWSAQGRDRDGITLAPYAALESERVKTDLGGFNHLDVGTPAQPLEDLLKDSIMPTLTGWYTTTQIGDLMIGFDPDGESAADRIWRAPTRFEWFSADEKYTGFLQVLYARDSDGNWHLLGGADPTTGEANTPPISAQGIPNSLDVEEPGEKTITVPVKYKQPTDYAIAEIRGLNVALPYKDVDGDPDDENIFPRNRLPKIGFQSSFDPTD